MTVLLTVAMLLQQVPLDCQRAQTSLEARLGTFGWAAGNCTSGTGQDLNKKRRDWMASAPRRSMQCRG